MPINKLENDRKVTVFSTRYWPWNCGLLLVSLSLFLWFIGIGHNYAFPFSIGGRVNLHVPFYQLPTVIGMILIAFTWIYKGQDFPTVLWKITPVKALIGYGIIALVLLTTSFLNLYSFQWNIWDVGSYSSSIYNLSQGDYYNSFMRGPALADHFTPSLGVLAPFYWLYPSAHWITMLKVLAYLVSCLAIFYWLSHKPISLQKRLWLSLLFGSAILMLYRPSVAGLQFEFYPSSLAIPIVVLCFMLMEQKRWFWFALAATFMLGLKEHLGVVLIGFGLYQIAFKNTKSGILLVVIGTATTLFLILFFIPSMRNLYPTGHMYTGIAPFKNIGAKVSYLIKLFFPLGFLPVYYWRYGIIAVPAIGINLMADREVMYSGRFHYNDVISVLLLIALLLILIDKPVGKWLRKRALKSWLLIVIASTLLKMPLSPGRRLWQSIPSKDDLVLTREIASVVDRFPNQSMALQSALGPHVHRKNMTVEAGGDNCAPGSIDRKNVDLILLAQGRGHYQISNLKGCIQSLEDNPDYQRLPGYKQLVVFKKRNAD